MGFFTEWFGHKAEPEIKRSNAVGRRKRRFKRWKKAKKIRRINEYIRTWNKRHAQRVWQRHPIQDPPETTRTSPYKKHPKLGKRGGLPIRKLW